MRSTVTRFVLALSLLAAVAASSTISADEASPAPLPTGPITAKQLAFRDAMRALWEDHITWTRLFIVDFTAHSPETDATTQRLLKNQVDIGDAIKPYYGAAAGDKLTDLLKQHILGAADLVAAATAGDTAKVDAASQRWYANAEEIAAFLSAANPTQWPLATMKAMMKDHLDNTLAEAVAHLKGDWSADIAAYDTVQRQILEMADMLSAGIINQFPASFA
jgi:prophage DNA circulation protein